MDWTEYDKFLLVAAILQSCRSVMCNIREKKDKSFVILRWICCVLPPSNGIFSCHINLIFQNKDRLINMKVQKFPHFTSLLEFAWRDLVPLPLVQCTCSKSNWNTQVCQKFPSGLSNIWHLAHVVEPCLPIWHKSSLWSGWANQLRLKPGNKLG